LTEVANNMDTTTLIASYLEQQSLATQTVDRILALALIEQYLIYYHFYERRNPIKSRQP
jgi:hypothetical protein